MLVFLTTKVQHRNYQNYNFLAFIRSQPIQIVSNVNGLYKNMKKKKDQKAHICCGETVQVFPSLSTLVGLAPTLWGLAAATIVLGVLMGRQLMNYLFLY